MLGPLVGCALVVGLVAYISVIACFIVAALGGIPLLYRACRHGVRFDDRGITVRNFFRTDKLGWHDVSRLTDGKVGIFSEGKVRYFWAVRIVLNSGRSVTAEGTMREKESNVPKVLATMARVAVRWQIPAQLTGKTPSVEELDEHGVPPAKLAPPREWLAPPHKWLAWLLAAVSFASGVMSVYVSLSITAHHFASRWKTEHILPEAPAIVAFFLGVGVVVWLRRYNWDKYSKKERIGLRIVLNLAVLLGAIGFMILTQQEPYSNSGS